MEKEVGLDLNREMRVAVKWLHRKCQHTKKGLRVTSGPFLIFGSVRQGTVCSLAGEKRLGSQEVGGREVGSRKSGSR